MKFFLLTILFTPTLGQYFADLGMRPDVTFGEHNDRFDLSSLIENQRPHYRQSEEDYRRKSLIRTDKKMVELAEDFGYHDSEVDDGTVADFEENLKKLQERKSRRFQDLVDHLHGQLGKSRRSNGGMVAKEPEKEILMHHAVPVEMTIDGYMLAPLVA